MGGAGFALNGWRLRGAALGAGALAVAIACALLLLASRTLLYQDDARTDGVEVLLTPREEVRQRDRRNPAQQRTARASSPDAPHDTRPAADRVALAQMLRCFGSRREGARPADCPREPEPPDWRRSAELPMGGDYYEPPPVDLERVYTRAELATIVMPPCGPGCVPVGQPPPPPIRSAEQICEDGGLGGPCRPPPLPD